MRQRNLLIGAILALFAAPCAASTTKPLAPAPTSHTALSAPVDADHFTFAVAGDNRSTGHGYRMPLTLDHICREIRLIGPNFVFWTGDVIEGYGDTPAEADREYDTFLASAEKTGVPFFNAPGNHEFSLNKALLPVYQRRMGGNLYGSFDYGNSHFIALDTTPVMPDGSISGGTLDPAQWAWLEADLRANAGAKNIFVMMHHYVFGPPDPDTPDLDTGWINTADRDRLHALMVKYKVRAVFSSHNHIFWHEVKDGVDYYISGGAGAPLDATPDMGGYHHYLLVAVDGAQVSVKILQPGNLDVMYPDGPQGGRVWVGNYNDVAISAAHIPLRVSPRAGMPVELTAETRYKDKVNSTEAHLLSVPSDGRAVVEATLPAHKTVEISIAPQAAAK